MKRIFDILFSIVGILILSPLFILIGIFVILDSRGGMLFRQERIGKNGCEFKVLKFRTMHPGSAGKGALTIGKKDPRVTSVGYYLRNYKLDELPQLFNVLMGDMSFVGPRPEVEKYTRLYTEEHKKKVLSVRPGITDFASIKFRNESEILAQSQDPEETYIKEIMPEKLRLNMKYIDNSNIFKDIFIIINTFYVLIKDRL